MFKKVASLLFALIGINAYAGCDNSIDNLTDPNIATDCFREGKFTEALKRADAIIQLDKKNPLSWRFKGEVLFQIEKYDDAVKAFESAERIGGVGTEEIFFWRALAYYNSGNLSKANEVFNNYLKADDNSPAMVARVNAALAKINGN
ncbi:tetratricopeptide repeat protein [Thalassolituus alkanivorans]|uniref:tetratricopeptide repeat protein n=1 Tax=Thalassolituus alkanivorans TaxID=2881055 RepID=UPI001E5F735D|nr:tetratricopeptide repeat protein [Thalassolituus alkanivorans]MCB2387254.1 tetratricopeptide repeat protein [Thalassolituus alkanivorans]MCB2421988.1 tetratricopeptide repeat protein [Thalassolituus alkanivorans]